MPLLANSLRTLSAALIVAALLIVGLVLGREILVPLALAVISCFILVPVVRWLEQHALPEWLAVSSVVVVVTGILLGASIALSSQLLSLAAELPAYRVNVMDKVHAVVGSSAPSGVVSQAIDAVETYQEMLNRELKLSADSSAQNPAPEGKSETKVVVKDNGSEAWRGIQILAEPLAQTAITFLFTLFLLAQYRDIRDRVVRVFGTENMTETTSAMSDAGERLSALFTGQVILNASFGVFVGCVLMIVGVPNAPLWGVVAFIMRFVPFVGVYVAAVPPVLLAAAVDPGWTKAICTLAVFVIGEPIMGQVLEPYFLGKRAGLSPFAMILAASFWTLVWGPIGLVLAAPLTLVVVVLGRYIPDLEFVSVLLGDEPPLSEQQEFYHRLLSGDAYAAVDQIDEDKEASSPEAVLDNLVFPALHLAVIDRRRGRFDVETMKELEETIGEVASESLPQTGNDGAAVLIVPVRGIFDILAARFAVGAINARVPDAASGLLSASGLTALSSIDPGRAAAPKKLVFITVVGVAEKALAFLEKKGTEKFPGAQVSILDLTRANGSIPVASRNNNNPQAFNRLTDLMASVKPETVSASTPSASKAQVATERGTVFSGSY
ncbi:MAG TPA: AI-2E family transporter [Hyphomicrobium sp.]|nr:AI-2E family transporter [Hyphomicrobium sp.]